MKKIYFIFSLFLFAITANAQVVINEVYGGGGNSGSTYKNDFIELYNNSSSAVSLTGWSVQYASAAGSTWQVTPLSGTIPANGYYLIQESADSGGSVPLPAPDASGSISMSGTAGKVALLNNSTALSGCPIASNPDLIDLVGFGSTANCYEGSGGTPSPSNTNSVQRSPEGFDSQDNSADFKAGAPSPTNGSSAADVDAPVVDSYSPANGATGVPLTFSASITFNEPVKKGTSGSILLKLTADNSTVQTIDISSR